ncbi:MAG: aminotransferase class I/II-fold pyridoxal phosphate-dependent enzyme [Chitinophagaceae bacterium]|uniref:DegT/DnrJ/EryC1/StrS family aminotransferase n=1 Tax=unclassified Paraflavitalea TaxID=2798305 RepID=UPI003D329C76|nr:aminotransferase class I/II-fold pyridoxal phosphate-dependent enzyme [Chitinophagaceae bacterium]
MKTKIWLSSPHMGGNELKYVNEAFASNWIAPLGPNVDGFENDLKRYLENRVAVAALSSGTAALHLALVLLGVGIEDEVICQSMTFAASANPIVYQGATPIFVDSEPDTWNMSPVFLEKAIEDRLVKGKKPKAIIVVHLYGMPAKMDEIMAVANKYSIPVIEDAAEALGSTYKGIPVGTIGQIGIFSFNGNKIITTSGGGAVVANDEALVKKARFLSTQALDPAPHYQHSHIGYNYRMSNISAGIGRGQMEVLNDRVNKRRENFAFYQNSFSSNNAIKMGTAPDGDFFSNHWLSTVLIESNEVSREDIRLALVAENIDCRPLWKPMHMQPVFENCPFYGDGTCERLFELGLCLPSGSNLKQEELDLVVNTVNSVFEAAKNKKKETIAV